MLDKVVILSCRKQAIMVFTDRAPFTITSDTDVVPLLMWFLDCPNVCLAIANDGETVTGIEVRKFDNEVTMKILLKDVA